MRIEVAGTESEVAEVAARFSMHEVIALDTKNGPSQDAVVFVFDSASTTEITAGLAVFVEATYRRISDINTFHKIPSFGFCGWPGLVNRSVIEVSLRSVSDTQKLDEVCRLLGCEAERVADQVGLITPRILAMIINEACMTLEEGTASKEDIDLAMKLGTNYPGGPFEWCKRIGAGRVVRLLRAVGKTTGDARYEVCKLLEKEAALTPQ